MNLGLVETRPEQSTFAVQKLEPFVTTLSGDPGTGEGVIYQLLVSEDGRMPDCTLPGIEGQKASAKVAGELRLEEGAPTLPRGRAH
jgi:hypothetical protein